MEQNKTIANDNSVEEYIQSIADEKRRNDIQWVHDRMKEITRQEPRMWGTSIVGFGQYHYKYDSGREGDFMKCGFSSRKTSITIYIMPGFHRFEELMGKLGKHSTGKSCLYIKKLADIDEDVLIELISCSYEYKNKKYPE